MSIYIAVSRSIIMYKNTKIFWHLQDDIDRSLCITIIMHWLSKHTRFKSEQNIMIMKPMFPFLLYCLNRFRFPDALFDRFLFVAASFELIFIDTLLLFHGVLIQQVPKSLTVRVLEVEMDGSHSSPINCIALSPFNVKLLYSRMIVSISTR